MERLEPFHVSLESESQLAYPLREPVHTQPKSQCGHYCVHQSYISLPCESTSRHNPTACTCSNYCTRTLFSSFPSSIVRHDRRVPCNSNTVCQCHTRTCLHQPSSPNPDHQAFPYYRCQRQATPSGARYSSHSHHSRLHIATNNLPYPSPHYATAYVSSSEVLSAYHREFHTQINPSRPNTHPTMHSHMHQHITEHISPTTCTGRFFPILGQLSYTNTPSHHIRRHASRVTSYPYPTSVIHYPYHPPRYICSTPYLLPPRHLIASGYNLVNELEVEPSDGEWDGSNRSSVEPKGLTKELIENLPQYLVTKKTMEEFTDGERCVVCMCEFDVGETLRILPCVHEFHSTCVDQWLETNATCPICRNVIS